MKQHWKYVPWGTDVEEFPTLEEAKKDISLAYALGAEEQAFAITTEDDIVVEAVWEDDGSKWIIESDMLGLTLEEVLDNYACGR